MPAQKTRMYTSIKSAISNLTPKFAKARQSGALYFFESEVKDVEQDERRVSPAWSSITCILSDHHAFLVPNTHLPCTK